MTVRDLQGAQEMYERVLVLEPSHLEAGGGLGRVLRERGEWQQAEVVFR